MFQPTRARTDAEVRASLATNPKLIEQRQRAQREQFQRFGEARRPQKQEKLRKAMIKAEIENAQRRMEVSDAC